MNAALHAHFRGAALPRFPRAALDFLVAEVVGAPAQVFRQLALGEGAELALEVADVGVVDVAVHDERNHIAVGLLAQKVGGLHHGVEVVAARLDQADDLLLIQRLASLCAFEDAEQARGHAGGRRPDAGKHVGRWRDLVPGAPIVCSRQAFAVDPVQHRGTQLRRHPSRGVQREAGIDGEALVQLLAGGGGLARQLAQLRPRRFRVHVVRRQRRHAAPVVDAGRDDAGQHARAQVRRRLNAHLRAEHQARHGDGPTAAPPSPAPARGASSCSAWRGSSAR